MYANVYLAFEKDPTIALLKQIKAQAAMTVVKHLRASGQSQRELATRAQVSQPRMSNLMRGRLDLFSLEALLEIAHRTGVPVCTSFNGRQTVYIG